MCLFLLLCAQLHVCVQPERLLSATDPPAGPEVPGLGAEGRPGHECVQRWTVGHFQTPAHLPRYQIIKTCFI